MVKSLISILSCVNHELNGFNQAIRDTWMPDAAQVGFDCRFFIGDGTPTGEDESSLLRSWQSSGIFKDKALFDPDISLMLNKSDHVILRVPDDYFHQAHKFREICRWAATYEYDYVFQVLTDTFVVPYRLMVSGFEQHDYIGSANSERTAIGGGAGMWLSLKALSILSNAKAYDWAYDGWAGKILLEHDIKLVHDTRYTNLGQQEPPKKNNDAITCHIANTPTVYDPQVMFDLYRGFYGKT